MNEQQVIKILFNNNGDLDYYKKYKYLPSKEIFMHSILQTDNYYFDKNIFIVHAHPQNIISYMGIEKSKELDTIKNIFPELNVGNIGKNVKYQEAGSIELANECYNKLKYNDIIGLERHSEMWDLMGYEPSFENKINIHVGGAYGDHAATAKRWIKTWHRLSDRLKARLVLENDDKPSMWSTRMLYDYFHKEIDNVIFLDCGSNSHDVISYLKTKKIKTIIVDHHIINSFDIPKSDILINPIKNKSQIKDSNVCTVTLTFF